MFVKINIDSNLISQLKRGDEKAFQTIYNQLYKHIFSLLVSLVKDQEQAEDLLQETFVRLWLTRGQLEESKSLYPYVYLIAKRLAIDHFRKKMLEVRSKESFQLYQKGISNQTEEFINASDISRFTKVAVDSLPKQQRQVFILSKNEGLSYDEIAERMHISRNTVKNHLVSAVRTLKIHFLKNDTILLLLFFFY